LIYGYILIDLNYVVMPIIKKTLSNKQIHRLKGIKMLHAQHAYTCLPQRKHQKRETADTIECLSMQKTLCLVGRGALKESAVGHPTSPWTESVPPHQREREQCRRVCGECGFVVGVWRQRVTERSRWLDGRQRRKKRRLVEIGRGWGRENRQQQSSLVFSLSLGLNCSWLDWCVEVPNQLRSRCSELQSHTHTNTDTAYSYEHTVQKALCLTPSMTFIEMDCMKNVMTFLREKPQAKSALHCIIMLDLVINNTNTHP